MERLEALPYAVNAFIARNNWKRRKPGANGRWKRRSDAHLTEPGGDDPGLDREEIQEQLYRYGTADSPQDLGVKNHNELYSDEPLGVVERVEKSR